MKVVGDSIPNGISKIGILPCASEPGSINFEKQCLHILTQKYEWIKVERIKKLKIGNLNQNMNPVLQYSKEWLC